MPEAYDVTIDGVGYMLKAGAYVRSQEGMDEGRVDRVRLFDFFGGARRSHQLERDRFWTGNRAWPTLDSLGLITGPKRTDHTQASSTVDPTARAWTIPYNGTIYVVKGAYLYTITPDASGYAGLTQEAALTATAVDVTLLGTKIVVAYGGSTPSDAYDLSVGGLTTGAYTAAGIVGTARGNAQAWLYYVKTGGFDRRDILHRETSPTNQQSTSLDAPALALVQHEGTLWILTHNSIVRESGDLSLSEVGSIPFLGYDDDLAWAVSHAGDLWIWMGKEVHRYDKSDDTFTPMGLRGQATYGAASVGRYLVVSVADELSGSVDLWAWDGRGWWLVDDGAAGTLYYPVPVFGVRHDADLLTGRGTTTGQTTVFQFFPNATAPGLASSMEVVSALLDAGERDKDKAWRRAGAEFAFPDDRATTSSVTVTLASSTDGGATWAQVATQTVNTTTGRIFTLEGAIAGARSRWLQLKVEISGVSDWCPVLVGMWAEHETIDAPTRRRKWRCTVQCRDRLVKRDGSVDTTGARALADGLWNAWDDGAVVAFRDVDYDHTLTTYNVRIVGIRETIPKLHDAATTADGEVELTLVEV